MDAAERCYRVASELPTEERFALADQIRRSAVSVPSNIAEGQSRQTTKSYVAHLRIARGSLAELETQLLLADRLHLGCTGRLDDLCEELIEIAKMLSALIRSLNKRAAAAKVNTDSQI